MEVVEVIVGSHYIGIDQMPLTKVGLHLLELLVFIRSELFVRSIVVPFRIPEQVDISGQINVRMMMLHMDPAELERRVKRVRQDRLGKLISLSQ